MAKPIRRGPAHFPIDDSSDEQSRFRHVIRAPAAVAAATPVIQFRLISTQIEDDPHHIDSKFFPRIQFPPARRVIRANIARTEWDDVEPVSAPPRFFPFIQYRPARPVIQFRSAALDKDEERIEPQSQFFRFNRTAAAAVAAAPVIKFRTTEGMTFEGDEAEAKPGFFRLVARLKALPVVLFTRVAPQPEPSNEGAIPSFFRIFRNTAAAVTTRPVIQFRIAKMEHELERMPDRFGYLPFPYYPIQYSDYEAIMQFDATQYTPSPTVYFEAVVKSSGGKDAVARLYNVTDGTAVAEVRTTSTTLTRSRVAVSLSGTKTYKAQAGTSPGEVTTMRGARLVVQQ